MRESIGGTMLFWIVLIFLSLFITFMASVIKYAFTYKMKNSLIDYIERSEGLVSEAELKSKLKDIGYPERSKYIVCKQKVGNDPNTTKILWYVKLHASFDMPIVNSTFDIPIQGETTYIQTGVLLDDPGWPSDPPNNCICRGFDQACVR